MCFIPLIARHNLMPKTRDTQGRLLMHQELEDLEAAATHENSRNTTGRWITLQLEALEAILIR